MKKAKADAKADQEYEDDDSGDEEGQGTLKFGRKKEQASYGDMDEDEKEMWKSMRGKGADVLEGDSDADASDAEEGGRGQMTLDKEDGDDLDYLQISDGIMANPMFGGVDVDKKSNTVAVTLKASASVSPSPRLVPRVVA